MKVSITALLLIPILLFSQEHQYHFPPQEFQARWGKIFDKIGEGTVIIQGAPDNGGFVYPRQSNTFYYLCGVENPNSYLVMEGKNRKVTLYPPRIGHVTKTEPTP